MFQNIFKKLLKKIFISGTWVKIRTYFIVINKRIFDSKNLMVDIGGGFCYKRYWKTLDFHSEWYSYNKRCIDYDFDLMSKERLPFEDDSVKLFYSEHTFEHVTDEAVQHTLDEMYRCLKKGGGIRIVVPDIDLAYQAYAKCDIEFFHSLWEEHKDLYNEVSIERLFLHYFAGYIENRVNPKKMRQDFNTMNKSEFLDSYSKQVEKLLETDPSPRMKFTGYHMNWFDYAKLERMLRQAGFEDIYKSAPKRSMFKEMIGEQFDTRPSWSLHVEATKHGDFDRKH